MNRTELIEARATVIERLKSQVDHVENKLDDIGDQPPTQQDLTYLAGLLRDLLDFVAETEEYAGMATQLLTRARILTDLEPRLRHVLLHQFSRKPRGKTWVETLIEKYPTTAHRSGLSSRLGA